MSGKPLQHAHLHAKHKARATPLQRTIEKLTARAGRPSFVVTILIVVAVWILLSLVTATVGATPFDPPPFAWLQGAITLAALVMTSLIGRPRGGRTRSRPTACS